MKATLKWVGIAVGAVIRFAHSCHAGFVRHGSDAAE